MEVLPPVDLNVQHRCPSCGRMSPGYYCMYCGEKLHHDRITFKRFAKGIPLVFFNFGKSFFDTVFVLVKRPGDFVKKYFKGDRARYYKPISFFMFIASLVLLLFLTFHISAPDNKIFEDFTNDKDLAAKLDDFNSQYLTGILFVQFPIIAFFTWLFFKRREHYFGEHLVANAFFIGEVNIYKILLFPIYLAVNHTNAVNTLDEVYALLVVGYYVYAFYDWLYSRKTWKGFLTILVFVVVLYIFIMLMTYFLVPLLYFIKQGIASLF